MKLIIAARIDPAFSEGFHFTTFSEKQWEGWACNDGDYIHVGEIDYDHAGLLRCLAGQVDEVVQAMEQKATAKYAEAMSQIADFKAKMLCLEVLP